MPFKIKLKKSRHYSVVNKSSFVISAELIDSTNVECTLSTDNTGEECLEMVCKKINLNQSNFFGLQYMSKNRENYLYWVELDRPLKKQLDKHARGLYVYLRVMYYVISGVRLLNDEVTRSHYFLQLKNDVIEGNITCTAKQAVELASYCMQAEFGNFNAERHTAHYLKDFNLFPKTFTDPHLLESLTDAAMRQHALLMNLPQSTAEEYYICACQKLDGYGLETFMVKERNGETAVLGVSLTNVIVNYHNGNKDSRTFRWSDITHVLNHKKEFTLELIQHSEKLEFVFPDEESAKNAWRFCVLQHIFYRNYESSECNDQFDKNPTHFQNIDDKFRQMDSYEDITNLAGNQWERSSTAQSQTLSQRAQSTSCLDLNTPTDIDKLRSMLPSYRPAPDYETAVQQKYRNSASAIQNLEPIRNTHGILYSSQPEIHQTDAFATHLHYPDVTHNNIEQKNLIYGGGYTENQPNLVNVTENMRLLHLRPPPPYPSNRINSNSTPDLAGLAGKQIKPPIHFVNNLVSGSSPDLVSSGNFLGHHYHKQYGQYFQGNGSAHPVHRSQSYLPPQHGTYENLASIFNNNMLARPQAVIVEDPNITKHIKKVYDEHGNIIYCMPANMKEILRENQLPTTTGFVVTRNQNALLSHPHNLNNSQEPIYENIPLPWQNENEQMRARTQSIHSAPEVSQVINHPVVNAIQTQYNQNISKENLYANISTSSLHLDQQQQQQQQALNTQKTQLNTSLSDTSLNLNHNQSNQHNSSMNTTTSTMSRTNTFIINKNSNASAFQDSINSTGGASEMLSSSANTSDMSNSTTASSGTPGKKKKRWGILIGRSKSSEKVKSATLGREKEKKDKLQNNNRHRWSTGLPRLHPLPPSISKETMCQLLENKLADSQLFFEFDKIPKKKQNAEFTTANLPENSAFNRFKDVLPYEDNRLRLTPTRGNRYGYINASHITATVGSKQRFYIAAQGPSRLTLAHFWQCVWEAEVYLIVQLTDPSEDLQYLPDAGERCLDIGQDYQVWWEFTQKTGHCVTSKIRLCHVASRRYRTLWHLHYTDWGEQGCPHNVAHFLGFLEEMQSVQQHSMTEIPPGHNKNPPVLVHCTAGVGRTGLTILSDLLLYTVDHNQEVDIPRVVGVLRHQRPFMVQTITQYRFVYSLLIHYLKQTRLI